MGDKAGDLAEQTANRLFVCFFADGPKWDNFVLTLALPAGISNYRPFRYGDHRVSNGVLEWLRLPLASEEPATGERDRSAAGPRRSRCQGQLLAGGPGRDRGPARARGTASPAVGIPPSPIRSSAGQTMEASETKHHALRPRCSPRCQDRQAPGRRGAPPGGSRLAPVDPKCR
jgi:hypothetical protein